MALYFREFTRYRIISFFKFYSLYGMGKAFMVLLLLAFCHGSQVRVLRYSLAIIIMGQDLNIGVEVKFISFVKAFKPTLACLKVFGAGHFFCHKLNLLPGDRVLLF